MADEDEQGRFAAGLIEGGAEIAGATVGGLLGTIVGPAGIAAGAVGGVAVTRLVKRLGAEIHERVLGPRQRIRVGAALAVAAERIEQRVESGEVPRTDGFFDAPAAGGRPPADELLEGVLLQAANAYEERKVPYMGALFASLTFRPDIAPAYANYLLRLADRLSYRQLTALAYFAENAEAEELVLLQADREVAGRRQFAEALAPELDELADDYRLLGIARPDGTVIPTGQAWGVSVVEQQLGNLALTELGRELYELMELSAIPEDEKRRIFTAMEQPTRGTGD